MQNEQIEQIDSFQEKELREHGAIEDDHLQMPGEAKMKIDLHCHSDASWDCWTPLDLIPDRCREMGIVVQAITDHNEIWGAKALEALVNSDPQTDLTIIVGEEISTAEGEIIGLFLDEKIEEGLSPEETVRRIKAQGGLVLLPHGFDPLKRYRLWPEARHRVVEDLDIVETFNARISRPRWNEAAVEWSLRNNLPMSAGTDAHRLEDIGSAWVEVPYGQIDGPLDLLDAIKDGVPVGDWTHPVWAFIQKMWGQVRQLLEA
jgi:predicted metal-dependent phosphoesterase TrpH